MARTRQMQFSSNRSAARHRVRYVESSAAVPGECRLCQGSLADRQPERFVYVPAASRPPLPAQVCEGLLRSVQNR